MAGAGKPSLAGSNAAAAGLLAPVVGAACCENGGSNRGNVSSSAMARIAAIVSGVRREFARQSREQRARRKDKEKYNKQGPGRGGF